ncbi:polysaccharide biosynthesis C-terminal domain-containing protein, partial [Bacillus thuringiensis]|nr:polysaccharide biosynthesis C-terminal domain-containing protein [Bacillus thuringiensis]
LGLVIGIIVKIVLNIVLLPYFDYVSFIISTYAGYTISVGFNLWMLSKYVIKAT